MPGQLYDFSCSACSLEWVMRARGLIAVDDIYASREARAYEIGYGSYCGGGVNLTPSVGLCDATGSALRAVLSDYGQPTEHSWLDFDSVYAIASAGTGMMSGAAWYHWIALRGVQGENLWIANSAPGYKGIWDTLSRADFSRLGGFSVVWLA